MSQEQESDSFPLADGHRTRMSLVWLAPLMAALIGGWIAIRTVLNHGPMITITFKDADGITAGKTKVRYKSVDVGSVKEVTIDADHRSIHVSVEIANFAKPFLVGDTRFWIVRPRLGASGVSGLETLISGAYIGMDVGHSKSGQREFVGLENAPVITGDMMGREFILDTPDLGSLSVGAPAYFHHIEVGEISALALNADGRGITLKVFIYAPYDRFVTADTRFWHASGIDMAIDSGGIRLLTQSITTILSGGIAFEAPANSNLSTPSVADARFQLFPNRDVAMKPPDRVIEPYILYFEESLRGLGPGAQVDFQGVTIGEVTSLRAEYDRSRDKFIFPVHINLYPERIHSHSAGDSDSRGASSHALVAHMITRGYRAQLRSGNLLTGQLYIALDLFPRSGKVIPQPALDPMPLPTVRSNLEAIQKTVLSVATKLDRMPIEKIGQDVDAALVTLNATLRSTNNVLGGNRGSGPPAPLATDLHATLSSISRAADSVRVLTDYLDQHPESLLRGKPKENQ